MCIVWIKCLVLSGLAGAWEGSLPVVVPCVIVARRRGAQADSLGLSRRGPVPE